MPRRSMIDSFRDALAGIRSVLRTQRNARIELGVAVLVVLLGSWLRLPARDWGVLWLAIGAVLSAEIFNTAIESLVDLLSPEHREAARNAKDAAAGAVLMFALTAVLVGLCVLGPPLWERLQAR